jgi:hypothetical protein
MSKSATKGQQEVLTPDHITDKDLQVIPDKKTKIARTAMGMIQTAVANGADVDTIERLVALQERQQARDAEVDFNAAMNRAQRAMGPVNKDLTNPSTRSKYASYKALDEMVRPIYTAEGFSISFNTGKSESPDNVLVFAYVSHEGGHTRTYQVDMPADGKGAKGGDVMTKTHATAAAGSYAMRNLLKMIFNIAIGEFDTDGNAPVDDEVRELIEIMQGATSFKELQGAFKEAFNVASAKHSKDALYLVEKTRKECNARLVADGVQP